MTANGDIYRDGLREMIFKKEKRGNDAVKEFRS
jgi:hypothetical protein